MWGSVLYTPWPAQTNRSKNTKRIQGRVHQTGRVYLIHADEEFDVRTSAIKATNLYPLPHTFLLIERQVKLLRDGDISEYLREHRVYSPAEDRWHVETRKGDDCFYTVQEWERATEDLLEDEWMFCEGFRKAVIAI